MESGDQSKRFDERKLQLIYMQSLLLTGGISLAAIDSIGEDLSLDEAVSRLRELTRQNAELRSKTFCIYYEYVDQYVLQ